MSEELFYKDGLHFECQRCSYCCGHSPGFVYLSLSDLERLCEYHKLGKKEFVEKYCRWVNYYYGTTVLALIEMKNYDCILWNNGCSAYEARPVQCSTYPFWTWMVADKETWQECSKDCPGINKGRLWTVQEIEMNRHKYALNKPLTIEEYNQLLLTDDSESSKKDNNE